MQHLKRGDIEMSGGSWFVFVLGTWVPSRQGPTDRDLRAYRRVRFPSAVLEKCSLYPGCDHQRVFRTGHGRYPFVMQRSLQYNGMCRCPDETLGTRCQVGLGFEGLFTSFGQLQCETRKLQGQNLLEAILMGCYHLF